MLLIHVMDRLLNVFIRRLSLLCIDDIDIVIALYLSLSSLDPVSIKDKDQVHALIALVIAQNIHKKQPCAVQIYLGKLL